MIVCVYALFSYAKHISYEKLRVATMFMASTRDIWFVSRKHTYSARVQFRAPQMQSEKRQREQSRTENEQDG